MNNEATVTPRVTIYTTSWCGSCRAARRFFQEKGVDYEEIDIEDAPEAATLVMGWARGYKTVPAMQIGDTVVVDWDRAAVTAALTKAGLA